MARPRDRGPQVLCRSVREAMGPMSARGLRPARRGDSRMVGVTGTNGKTTTPTCWRRSFRAAGWRPGVIGTTGARDRRRAGAARAHDARGARPPPPAGPDARRRRARRGDGGLVARARAAPGRRAVGSTSRCSRTCPRTTSTTTARWRPTSPRRRLLFTPDARAAAASVNADDPWGRRLLEVPPDPVTTFGLDAAADVRATRRGGDRRGISVPRSATSTVTLGLRGPVQRSKLSGARSSRPRGARA